MNTRQRRMTVFILLAAIALTSAAPAARADSPTNPDLGEVLRVLADGVRSWGSVQQEPPRQCFGCPTMPSNGSGTVVVEPVPNRRGEWTVREYNTRDGYTSTKRCETLSTINGPQMVCR
jgi:hypothetical protein